jgi:poly(3-hydroxybutyrate) depolymerase
VRPALAALGLSLLTLLFARALQAGDDAAPALPRWKPGEQTGLVQIEGQDERFVALVPAGYTTKKPVATVLLLHGNGDTAANFLRVVRTFVGKTPPLLIALERCDNKQKAEGYAPKYLDALKTQFAIDESKLFAVGFSGGGFRAWDDLVAQAEEAKKYRGIVLVGSARQNLDPADKPEKPPTVILVGDPKDGNFTENGPAAEKQLLEKGYEVILLEHRGGHSMPPSEMKDVFAWIDAVVAGKKTTLATRRLADEGKPPKKK